MRNVKLTGNEFSPGCSRRSQTYGRTVGQLHIKRQVYEAVRQVALPKSIVQIIQAVLGVISKQYIRDYVSTMAMYQQKNTNKMRNLFAFNMVTVDGFFAGENGEIEWHNVDAEFEAFASEQMAEIDTVVFGRKTYELMAAFWPTSEARRQAPGTAAAMNGARKLVTSRAGLPLSWDGAELIEEPIADSLIRVKQESGKSIAVLGSATLIDALLPTGVIDEYRIMVNPILLGKGVPLFKSSGFSTRFHLAGSRAFQSGNVLLTYRL